MRAIVTGASSGIGLAVCKRLIRDGLEVHGLCRYPPSEPAIRWHRCDFVYGLGSALEGVGDADVVVHAAFTYEPRALARVGRWALVALEPACRTGSLVVLSSTAVLTPEPGSDYVADKIAQESLAMEWAKSHAPAGRVNIVRPGYVSRTRTWPQEDPERAATLPLKRFPTPEDVADAVAMVALNRSMTGSVVTVDGGWSVGRST